MLHSLDFAPAPISLVFCRPSGASPTADEQRRSSGYCSDLRELGGAFVNVNAGIVTSGIKTLVAFGDSDGGPLAAAVLNGTSPRAGGGDLGATIKDYAVSGAVVNVTLWPSKAGQSDFLHQAALFLSQNNALNSATTLYTVFFGINDFSASSTDGNHLPEAAAELLTQIKQLASAPTNARNIVVLDDYGRGKHSATGDAWKQAVFDGLSSLRAQGLNVAFVDFAPLWDGRFAAFGYANSGARIPNLSQTDLSGECSTPLNSFYWLPNHPSKETHRIMADYVDFVLAKCKA
ncbi:carbohydrate esterase family 16 protein [Favolaschia claudopus]|uniref:Carbohydrate esterase family 16 protein n=1 Tax=Favolaschia claudopus TaxID=2862362 RepID=A0AAW0CKJ8_9AGAR